MRKYLLPCLVVLCLVVGGSAWSLPLNEYNEALNGAFETGDLSNWQAGADILVAEDGPGHGWAATCKSSGVDVWLRQIVDDSLNPYWNWDYSTKRIDLIADITWSGLVQNSSSGILFRLDWWDARWDALADPTGLPYYAGPPPAGSDPSVGYYVSEWVSYSFEGVPQGQWLAVNPFNRIDLPIQPRWVSIEVSFLQAAGEAVWLDNVVLTAECVPEPSGALAMIAGIGPILGLLRYRRRQ